MLTCSLTVANTWAPNNGVDGLAHHVFRLPAKPARVAAIGVLVGPAVVKIGNVRRNGVGDQPQPPAALERALVISALAAMAWVSRV